MHWIIWGALKQRGYSYDLPHAGEVLKRGKQKALNELNEPHTLRKENDELITVTKKCVEVLDI